MSKQFEILENTKTMFRSATLNDKQLAKVQEIVNFYNKTIVTNNEIRIAMGSTETQIKYCPYYIYRNLSCRTKDHKFDLSKLRSKTASIVLDNATNTSVKTRSKRENRAKRENRSKVVVTSAPALEQHSDVALEQHSDDVALEALEQRMIEA